MTQSRHTEILPENILCYFSDRPVTYVFNWWCAIDSEKAMAPHSSTLAWKIPWTEQPGRLQSMESLEVRHNWATSLSLFTFMHWRRKWQPTPVFLSENPRDRGAWWAAVYGVAQSRTRLKWLSSSSSSRQHIKKQRHYFVNKSPSSQGCGFSSSCV